MHKYRIEFENNEVKSIQPTEQDVPQNDTILEPHTGDIMWTIIHAEDDEDARAKAQKLSRDFKNRRGPSLDAQPDKNDPEV